MRVYEDYYWLNEESRTFLKRGYLREGVSPEERIKEIGDHAEKILGEKGFSARFEECMKRGWFSLASPIWSNFGLDRGLPISCNGSYIGDSMEDILSKVSEIGMMTKMGAGTSAYFGDLRPRGSSIGNNDGKSMGAVHFMELFDKTTTVISQSNVRRGQCAAYLPVEHGDIEEFLQIRGEGHSIQKLSIGVCISDAWMEDMIAGDADKRRIWTKIIQMRFETGYPYSFFSDTVNNNAPEVYSSTRRRHWIRASNLCSEIALSSDKNSSFVCCLSSMNLLHYDEWVNTDAVAILTKFLDAVMSSYIELTAEIPFMGDANYFAATQRAIGVGVLGWHSYLQSKGIAFSSFEAKLLNVEIFKHIQAETEQASKEMAAIHGPAPIYQHSAVGPENWKRNTTLMAVAPTASSSFILGQVSASIEPLASNYFIQDLDRIKSTYKNPYLKELLIEKGQDTKETWMSILDRGGSVQHLECLTPEEKAVFETFGEISQKEVVIQASARQKYIDQSQSLNLMIPFNTSPKEVSDLLIERWRLGVKTFYYQKGTNPSQSLSQNISSCKSCEA